MDKLKQLKSKLESQMGKETQSAAMDLTLALIFFSLYLLVTR